MIRKFLTVFILALVASAATAADTYRWEDEEGNVHYSDELPPTGARNVQRARLQGGAAEQVLPYRLQVAVDKFPVTLYVTDCGEPCELARGLLRERGVPHTLLDADQHDVQQMMIKLTSDELVVPTVSVGKKVLRGFEVSQWNAALDAAGYPRYAMIEVTPDAPAPVDRADTPGGEADVLSGTEAAQQDAESFDAAEVDSAEVGNEDGEPAQAEEAQ